MNRKITRKIALLLAVATMLASVLALNVFADNSVEEVGGAGKETGEYISLEQQYREYLSGEDVFIESKLATLAQAKDDGLDWEALADDTITTEQRQSIEDGSFEAALLEMLHQNAVTISFEDAKEGVSFAAKAISGVSGNPTRVTLPDYQLWPKTYYQEKSNTCGPATLRTVLYYLHECAGTSFSMTETQAKNLVGIGPDSGSMITAINSNKPSSYASYAKKYFNGSQSTYDTNVKNAVVKAKPLMMSFSNPSDKNWWPFHTVNSSGIETGHWISCNGGTSWDNEYYFSDTFYFKEYVPSAPYKQANYTNRNAGKVWRVWSNINAATKHWHEGTSKQFIVA